MRNLKFNSKKGFTLIEMLVVTALIGILSLVSSQVVVDVLESQNEVQVINQLRQEGDYVVNLFERDVRNASGDIDPAGTLANFITFNTHSGTVTWICDDGSIPTREITRNNTPITTLDDVSGSELTDNPVALPRNCSFFVTLAKPQIVTFEFELESAPNASAQEVHVPFKTSVTTRLPN